MPRLRQHTAVVALECLAILFSLVAAPQAGAGSPTKASWAAAANKACGASYAKVDALPRPTTRALLIADLHATLQISKRLMHQLSQIPAPAAERGTIGQLLTLENSGDGIVDQKLLPALLNGDQAAAARFAAQSNRIGARFNTIARTLGARICAENPVPQG
jgi:hypothetical protein